MSGGDKFIRRFAPGERVIVEGESSSEIFILLRGELTVWRGRSELGKVSSHGDVIGELAAFTRRPRAATVVAATHTELLVVSVDLKSLSQRLPDALEKIDMAIMVRYEIARKKARIFATNAALARRLALQDVMVQHDYLHIGKKKVADSTVRKAARQRLDDALAIYNDADDPRILKKVADEYGVLTEYQKELNSKPWLDEGIALRIEVLENRFTLCSGDHDLKAIRERASVTAEMLDLLGEYESIPGIVVQNQIYRLEKIIPFDARMMTIRTLVMHTAIDDEPQRAFLERKVLMVVEKCKFNAGKDPVILHPGAEELGVASDYLAEMKRLASLSESSSSLVDAPSL